MRNHQALLIYRPVSTLDAKILSNAQSPTDKASHSPLFFNIPGNFEQGSSGDIQIATGNMRPKRSIDGRPGDIILQSGSAGNEEVYHNGRKWHGYRTHSNHNTQSQGGGLSLSSGDSYDGQGGDLSINSGVGLFEGGTINITSGFGIKSNGGDFHLGAGASRDEAGGDFTLSAGLSSSSDSGSIKIGGGEGFRKGSVHLLGSDAVTGDGGDVLITSGSSNAGKSGSVMIESPYSAYGNGEVNLKSNGKAEMSGKLTFSFHYSCSAKFIVQRPNTFSVFMQVMMCCFIPRTVITLGKLRYRAAIRSMEKLVILIL